MKTGVKLILLIQLIVTTQQVVLNNCIGQLVKQTKAVNTIDLCALNSGLYFIQVINEQGEIIKASKILKE